ncbi:MAG: outer membrane beta-barrel protein [Saprospiraceae bacterium]
MCHLQRIALITGVFLLALQANLSAQRGNYNYLDFENKPYYFGIVLAYNNSDYKISQSKDFLLNDSIRIAESLRGVGFNLGGIVNLKVGRYFDFRTQPTLSFAERKLLYKSPGDIRAPYTRQVQSVLFEIPFHIRFKSEPYNDKRFFLVTGVKYGVDVANDSRSRDAAELVKIAPSDFMFEVGAGLQIFFPYFIFSPEIKYSHGLGNVMVIDPNLPQSNVIDRLVSRSITISFHFEG